MIDAVVGTLSGELHTGILRIGAQQLPDGGGRPGERQCLAIDEKWIRGGLHQGYILPGIREGGITLRGGLGEQGIGNLVNLLRILREMSALRAYVGRGDEEARG